MIKSTLIGKSADLWITIQKKWSKQDGERQKHFYRNSIYLRAVTHVFILRLRWFNLGNLERFRLLEINITLT